MNLENLHTCALEKLFGPIALQIVKQDEDIRIIELNDVQGISRTLAIVHFFNANREVISTAHEDILNGAILGKTLFDFNIDFNKEFIGSVEVKLPKSIKQDFKSNNDNALAFFSKITINDKTASNGMFLYAELIEVIPSELIHKFNDKLKPLHLINENLRFLLKSANLELIKKKHES